MIWGFYQEEYQQTIRSSSVKRGRQNVPGNSGKVRRKTSFLNAREGKSLSQNLPVRIVQIRLRMTQAKTA